MCESVYVCEGLSGEERAIGGFEERAGEQQQQGNSGRATMVIVCGQLRMAFPYDSFKKGKFKFLNQRKSNKVFIISYFLKILVLIVFFGCFQD